jgi:hypothetical protein
MDKDLKIGKIKIRLDGDFIIINVESFNYEITQRLYVINFKTKKVKDIKRWDDCFINEDNFTICTYPNGRNGIMLDSANYFSDGLGTRYILRLHPDKSSINKDIKIDTSKILDRYGSKFDPEFIYNGLIESLSIIASSYD